MSKKQNLELVRNLFDDVFSGGNADAMGKYFTENVKLQDPATPKFHGGLEGWMKLEKQYQLAFPNKKCTINQIFGSDNLVTVHWTVTGSHKGTLAGYAPTGNTITVSGISVYEFANDGKIQSVLQIWDRLALLEQIGEAQTLSVS